MARGVTENLSPSLEDYLEAIFNLSGESDCARSKDIARCLGVSMPSVTGALKLLRAKGMANYSPYNCVSLTETGRSAAAEIVRKHRILKLFFIDLLGVDGRVGQEAACKVEHLLGPEIINRLLYFIEFATEGGDEGEDLSERFRAYYKSRSRGVSGGRKQARGR